MPGVYQEFNDQNQHRAYPLTDDSYGQDVTDTFHLPESLITDIFLCAPNLPNISVSKFYVKQVTIRRYFIEVTIGYEDVSDAVGVFSRISTDADVGQMYDFTPSQIQSNDAYAPLFFMSGQITIGTASEVLNSLGSWEFDYAQTKISPTRIGRGLVNVQYIELNGQLLTGTVRFKSGKNVELSLSQDGDTNVITIDASLEEQESLELNSDADVLSALTNDFGEPVREINGVRPDGNRDFFFQGEDCTSVDENAAGIVLGNPCATPCCDENTNVEQLLQNIANLNLRYAHLKSYFDAQSEIVNSIQNKLLILNAGL